MKKTIIITSLLSCFSCDQLTKAHASLLLKGNEPLSFVGNVFRLQYAENTGAMLGAGSHLPENHKYYVFTIGVGLLLLAALCYLLIKPLSNATVLFGSLIIAGGFGNWYDRVLNDGAVVDFINVGIGALRTGIFNVADVTILIGAIGLIVFSSNDDASSRKPTKQ